MKSSFRNILIKLFSRQEEISPTAVVRAATFNPNINPADTRRCKQILNYWLDSELFELPTYSNNKKSPSLPPFKFVENWSFESKERLKQHKINLTQDSRVFIMFQCHLAEYIAKEDSREPNFKTPRTYLVGYALIPSWNEERQCITWQSSGEDSETIINLATLRTLYRQCRSIAKNQSLSEWVKGQMEAIDELLTSSFYEQETVKEFTTDEIYLLLHKINKTISNFFWTDAQSKHFITSLSKPAPEGKDNEIPLDNDDYHQRKQDGSITFRWRHIFHPNAPQNIQLGPFFTKDLEACIDSLEENDLAGLSKPLQRYLLGQQSKIDLSQAHCRKNTFAPIIKQPTLGRWPSNPDFGLSLMQRVAVNIAQQTQENPIVAVNGPPGTGKTTLLKDIITDHFILRTKDLIIHSEDTNWFSKQSCIESLMEHSIIVASSNNKAVENISKELPALENIAEEYVDNISYFRDEATERAGNWGTFTAVLGKASNRKEFKNQLGDLKEHLAQANDALKLQAFYNELQDRREQVESIINKYANFWSKKQRYANLLRYLNMLKSSKPVQHTQLCLFFEQIQNAQGPEEVSSLAENLKNRPLDEWNSLLDALNTFRRHWFGKKHHADYLNRELLTAKNRFIKLYQEARNRTLNSTLPSYTPAENETSLEAETRLQLSSPFGDKALNDIKSQLFIAALDFNEALIKSTAVQFAEHWNPLIQLIDGHYESQEKQPHHQQLWAMLFLFFPVVSTSLASIESQFKLMQKKSGFGIAMIDEAGQAIGYQVTGLLQRCRQAIFVGDPIQIKPVVTLDKAIDRKIAESFLTLSQNDGEHRWEDDFLITNSSAQTIADLASNYCAKIGERTVGIPLLVHRRCQEPMFSIANQIAYDNKMIQGVKHANSNEPTLISSWLHVEETPNSSGYKVTNDYKNETEAKSVIKLLQSLATKHEHLLDGGVYIITPFTQMAECLSRTWGSTNIKEPWVQKILQASGLPENREGWQAFKGQNIGTVHTFQGKEAGVVIFCLAASEARNKLGGISWVNSEPNLINVAVTRAKKYFFVVGNAHDWASGYSRTMQKSLQPLVLEDEHM